MNFLASWQMKLFAACHIRICKAWTPHAARTEDGDRRTPEEYIVPCRERKKMDLKNIIKSPPLVS